MIVKIAVVQFSSPQNAVEDNLQKAECFIKEAKSKQADIVVFPEDFIDTGELKPEFVDFNNKHRHLFQRLAKTYDVDLVTGSWTESEDNQWYNTTYYIDRSGTVKSRYRKINLWLSERPQITAGKELAVFDTRFGRVSLAICWDLVSPELFGRMASAGAEIVFCPSWWESEDAKTGGWVADESMVVDSLCQARAFENNIILVFCNVAADAYIGTESHLPVGHSQIALPAQTLAKLGHNKQELMLVEVDTAVLAAADDVFKVKSCRQQLQSLR